MASSAEREDKRWKETLLNGSLLSMLETDHLITILQRLPAQSVVKFGMTCRRFHKVSASDLVWRVLYYRDLDPRLEGAPTVSESSGGIFLHLYRDILTLNSASWHSIRQLGEAPQARASSVLNCLQGRITLYGGGCHGGRHLDDTWVMDPSRMQQSNGADEEVRWIKACSQEPWGRFQPSCTVVDDTLVLFGGINDFGTRLNDTWINRGAEVAKPPAVSTWKQLCINNLPAPRGAHAACHAGGQRVVLFGGIGQDGKRLGDTWLLDLDLEPPAWQELRVNGAPSARSGHSLSRVSSSSFVLFGGRGSKLEVLGDSWLLELHGIDARWSRLHSARGQATPGPRAGHTATPIFGGRVLICGGEDDKRSRKADVWLLNPHGTAQPLGHHPSPRAATLVPEEVPPGDLQVVPQITQVGMEPVTKQNGRSIKEAQAYCSADCAADLQQGQRDVQFGLDEGSFRDRLWRQIHCGGEPPSGRAYHCACGLPGGKGVCIFGGMIDGEESGTHTGQGINFDDHLFFLSFVTAK